MIGKKFENLSALIAVLATLSIFISACSSGLEFQVEIFSLDGDAKRHFRELHADPLEYTRTEHDSINRKVNQRIEMLKDWHRIVYLITNEEKGELENLLQMESENLFDALRKLAKGRPEDENLKVKIKAVDGKFESVNNIISSVRKMFDDSRKDSLPIGGLKIVLIDAIEDAEHSIEIDEDIENVVRKLNEVLSHERKNSIRQSLNFSEEISFEEVIHKAVVMEFTSPLALPSVGLDGVSRNHSVYQDLSDPFLQYVMNNPKKWKALGVPTRVIGDGDTEFVFVIENVLDGRFKRITNDPSKVIQSRARILNQVLSVFSAQSGVYFGDISIPVYKNSDRDPEEIQLTELTSRTISAREQRESIRIKLEHIRRQAAMRLTRLREDTGEKEVLQLILELVSELSRFNESQSDQTQPAGE